MCLQRLHLQYPAVIEAAHSCPRQYLTQLDVHCNVRALGALCAGYVVKWNLPPRARRAQQLDAELGIAAIEPTPRRHPRGVGRTIGLTGTYLRVRLAGP